MERLRIADVNAALDIVEKELETPMLLQNYCGYYKVMLKFDGSGRDLKSGTLRECDTFIRGMIEALSIIRHGF
jgi:hypothetical protein